MVSSGQTSRPYWAYNEYKRQPNKEKNIYVHGQPIVSRYAPGRKFVDNFSFPAPVKSARLPLPEADWSIDRRLYQGSNNPKSIYITNQGTFATKENNPYLPNLQPGSSLGWSGEIRGDLNRIQYERQPLKYLGSEEQYNEWRPLSKT